MPVSGANLKWYLSGGTGNSDPAAALGGARSTATEVPTGLFDTVTGAESAAGDIEYRCIYWRNEDSDADGVIDPKVFIQSNTPSADTTIAIGVDPAGKNASATTIANESAAPAGVTFSSPTDYAGGIALPSGPYVQNDFIAIWVRRTVDAGAASAASDAATIRVQGDTI